MTIVEYNPVAKTNTYHSMTDREIKRLSRIKKDIARVHVLQENMRSQLLELEALKQSLLNETEVEFNDI